MIDCQFLAEHGICTHPALRERKGRKCAYAERAVCESWRCFFRLPKKEREEIDE